MSLDGRLPTDLSRVTSDARDREGGGGGDGGRVGGNGHDFSVVFLLVTSVVRQILTFDTG